MNERVSARPRQRAVRRQGGARPGWLRAALLALCALPIASAAATGLALALAGSQRPAATDRGFPAAVEVVVAPGDSLWSIARRCLPLEADLRAGVDAIMRLNDMSSCLVRPGEVLLVPVSGSGAAGDRARGADPARIALARHTTLARSNAGGEACAQAATRSEARAEAAARSLR